MKRTLANVSFALLTATMVCGSVHAQSAGAPVDQELTFSHRRLNGPRMGMTYVLPWDSPMREHLKEEEIGNLISQFGWHFEWLVSPEVGGPSFVVQLIPFLGGVEYGTVLPTTSLVMGIRLPRGFEFGMGPNVIVTPTMETPVNPALVVGVGKSIDFRGVSIPLNIALTTNREGHRVSFICGYAIPKRDRRERYAESASDTREVLASN